MLNINGIATLLELTKAGKESELMRIFKGSINEADFIKLTKALDIISSVFHKDTNASIKSSNDSKTKLQQSGRTHFSSTETKYDKILSPENTDQLYNFADTSNENAPYGITGSLPIPEKAAITNTTIHSTLNYVPQRYEKPIIIPNIPDEDKNKKLNKSIYLKNYRTEFTKETGERNLTQNIESNSNTSNIESTMAEAASSVLNSVWKPTKKAQSNDSTSYEELSSENSDAQHRQKTRMNEKNKLQKTARDNGKSEWKCYATFGPDTAPPANLDFAVNETEAGTVRGNRNNVSHLVLQLDNYAVNNNRTSTSVQKYSTDKSVNVLDKKQMQQPKIDKIEKIQEEKNQENPAKNSVGRNKIKNFKREEKESYKRNSVPSAPLLARHLITHNLDNMPVGDPGRTPKRSDSLDKIYAENERFALLENEKKYQKDELFAQASSFRPRNSPFNFIFDRV